MGTVGLWLAVLVAPPSDAAELRGILYFILAGLVGTTAGRLLRFLSIEQVGASVSAALINLHPFIAAGLAILLLGEAVTAPIVVGTAVIVVGTVLLSASGRILHFRPSQLVLPFLSAACFGAVAILRKLGLGGGGTVPRLRRQRHHRPRRLHRGSCRLRSPAPSSVRAAKRRPT